MRRFLLALLLVATVHGAAHAATHALLIAASRYDHLPKEKHLQGPNADVAAMRDALGRWQVAATTMRVLADEVPGANGRPTLANIRAGLAALATDRVQPGDWVVIYLSGHGAIVRDSTGTQRSGLNSVFLPADVRWPSPDASDSAPENALFDVEIGAALDRIRARGAHVWFVNDSCHSGDTVRGAAEEAVRDKSVLAAPRTPGGKAPKPRPLAARKPAEALPGRLVAFYAAQVTETAREFRGEDGQWRSAFTLALTNAMARGETRDARSLIARSVHGVRAMRPLGIFQTPYADEDLGDGEALLGGTSSELRNPLEGTGEVVQAGLLDGLDAGAEIDAYDTAVSASPLSRLRVVQGGLTRSRVQAVTGSSVPQGPWFGRLVSSGREGKLSVALMEGDAGTQAPATRALEQLLSETLQPVQRAAAPQAADVVLHPEQGRVRLVARKALLGIAQQMEIPLAGADDPAFPARLATALQRFDFLRRMERAQSLASAQPASERFKVQMTLRKFAGGAGTPCPAPAKDARAEALGPALPLASCDAVEVEVRNASDKPRFVQVLAVHPDGRVQTIAPRCGGGGALKLEAGQATAGRLSAGAKTALPVIWFSLPKGDGSMANRMALQLVSMPIDATAVAPDPCQFERFNGARSVPTRGGAPLFDEDSRSGRAGEIALQARILEWASR